MVNSSNHIHLPHKNEWNLSLSLLHHIFHCHIRVMVPTPAFCPSSDLDCLLWAPVDTGIAPGAGAAPDDSTVGDGDIPCRAYPAADPAPVAAIGCMETPGSAVDGCDEESEEGCHNPVGC